MRSPEAGSECCCSSGGAEGSPSGRSACRCGGNIPRHLILPNIPRHLILPAILFLLDEEPRHGYALLQRLSELGIADAGVSPATVYRVLSRLEEEGLAVHEHADDGQGPTRKVYSLTDAGREALADWRSHIQRTRELLDWITRGPRVARRPAGGRPFAAVLSLPCRGRAGGGVPPHQRRRPPAPEHRARGIPLLVARPAGARGIRGRLLLPRRLDLQPLPPPRVTRGGRGL